MTPLISLLVPFKDDGTRGKAWDWLERFWRHALPDSELVIGTDEGTPFSKAVALNDAASRATGQALVLLDSDCYLDPQVLRDCAAAIVRSPEPRWFTPYHYLYRLTPETSARLLASDPTNPMRLWEEDGLPRESWISRATNEYGAMVLVVPREAFDLVGGWDERFVGWGGEDRAFMQAVDTLYAPHSMTMNNIYHIFHEVHGEGARRRWTGQELPFNNYVLSARYRGATGWPDRMRRLIDEGRS